MKVRRSVIACAVAWMAGTAALGAQGGQPPRDSTRRDSSAAARPPRDSVKAPFTVGEAAGAPTLGRTWRWNRDEIFRGGAVSLADLLSQIPGASVMQTGLLLAPQAVRWWEQPGAVRVYLDGIEVDGINPRDGRVQDLGAIAIWNLDEVVAEATPAELRVHLRTWRSTRTSAETRVDVLTGDQQTNLYRAYYGRRFQSGLGVQLGFQQFSTTFERAGGDGDALSMFGRLGWTRNDWSVDIVTQRDSRTRSATFREDGSLGTASVPALTSKPSLSYVRLGFRSPDGNKPWLQAIASGHAFREETPVQTLPPTFGTLPPDSADTNVFRAQYLVAGGFALGGFRSSATARYREFNGQGYLTPSARASLTAGSATAQGFVERDERDSVLRADLGVSLTVWSHFSLFASASRRSPLNDLNAATTSASAEGAIRVGRLHFLGGVAARALVTTAAPVAFADSITPATLKASRGTTAGIWGAIYKDVSIDVRGTLFHAAGIYRPKSEFRARIGLDSDWRSRFPRGDFTVRASLLYEHLGATLVPVGSQIVTLPGASPLTSILEVRIKSATLTWQFRNFLGTLYETVPGYPMPARVNLYGIRWNFTN